MISLAAQHRANLPWGRVLGQNPATLLVLSFE
jgi:hypothetical protein